MFMLVRFCSSSMKALRVLRPILSTWRTQTFCTKPDAPIKFTTSKAKTWKAEYSRKGIAEEDESVWYQPLVVSASVAIFLLYFCVLREENDIDEEIGRSLYGRIDGLEEVQLRRVLEYNLNQGKDTADIVARLRELESLRRAKANPE